MWNDLVTGLKELFNLCLLKGIAAGVGVWALEMAGYPDSAVKYLLYLMGVDLILGCIRSWKVETFCKAGLFKGAAKFFKYWLAISVFTSVDAAVSKAMEDFIDAGLLRDWFIAYLAANEALSITTHLAFFGFPVPEPFLRRLRKYRDNISQPQTEFPEASK